jgi:undecaprenyl pyrophosphate synthase
LRELSARIARLRERLERGDQEMTGDEIMAAIERAEAKRADLENSLPEAKVSYRLIGRLAKFAEAFRRQITKARRRPTSRSSGAGHPAPAVLRGDSAAP